MSASTGIDAAVVAPIATAAALYALGTGRAWRLSGVGRGVPLAAAGWFTLGLAALVVALVGPLDRLGEALFSGHVAQHLLLMNVAAPLLVLSSPVGTFLRALPAALRRALVGAARSPAWRRGWRWVTGATAATVLQLFVVGAWHLPVPIAVSRVDDPVHATMHASLLAAALIFWTMALAPGRRARWRGVAALVVTAQATGLACILLLLQDGLVYDSYGTGLRAHGLDAETDEHLGWGLTMVASGTSYLVAATMRFFRATARDDGIGALRPALP